MAEQPDPNQTVDEPDPLDAGLAAAFGPDSGPPLPAAGSVVQALGADPVQLRTPVTEPEGPVVLPHSDALPAQAPPPLQLLGEIARGGMGAVLKGRDTDLGRDIAVKVLLETHQGKTELVQRFVEEAQIAGQLQHPGITPVYELGQFADKRPYFTMKLVKGKTLAALLTSRPDPAAERTQFVGIFAQVCQTLAYAHARGVIHRDLKPSNVMVGSFGEVQVMDWGLAKVLKKGGVADERQAQTHQTVSVIQTQRSAGLPVSGSHTQAGSVLGTPAYMAPEQARGEVDLVDARADVFGLGAILCEILTGQPPFTGQRAEAQRKAQTAQLDDAFRRLSDCGADAELIGLARQCLAAEPWDRPRDAGAVAAAVAAYQNSVGERLRQAELAHAAEMARTEEAQATAAQERKAREAAQARAVAERRARRLTLGLAASVLALVAVGAAGGLWVQRQRAERTAEGLRQREAVEVALDKARELRQQARWAEARAILEQTRDRLGEAGPEDLRQRVEQATADLTLVDRLEDIRLKRSTVVEGKFNDRSTDRDYAATFRDAGLGEEGDDMETVAARLRDSTVGEQLVATLDDWATATKDPMRRAWLLAVARRADPDAWRDRFRDPNVRGSPILLEELAKELLDDDKELATQNPQLLATFGIALVWAKGSAVPVLAKAQALHPDDFWLNFDLGHALGDARKWNEAVGFYRAAVAVRPAAAAAHHNLGLALHENQQLEEAIQEYRRAIVLDPNFALPHNNLGNALVDKKQLDEAIKEYRRAIVLDPKLAHPHNGLGNAVRAKQQPDEAIKEYHRAIDLDPKLSLPHNGLGNALTDKQQLNDAISEYRIAIKLDPKDARPHVGFGNALREKKQLDEAIKEYRIAIALNPKFAMPHNNLGNALRAKQQLDKAIQEYRIAITLDPKDALPHNGLGIVLIDKQQPDEAMEEFLIAIALDPRFAMPHNGLGLALHAKQHVDEAMEEFRIAIHLDPSFAMAHNNLGSTHRAKHQLDAAIKEYRIAIALDPDLAMSHSNLGSTLCDKQQLSDAVLEFRIAINLEPMVAKTHGALGHTLLQLGRFTEARESMRRCLALVQRDDRLRQVVTGLLQQCEQLLALDQKVAAILEGKEKPADDAELLALAQLCQQPYKKLYAASSHFFAEAFASDARLADDVQQQRRYNAACAAALAGCGQGNDADKLDDKERSRLRKQAVAWLRADLPHWTKQVASDKPKERELVQTTLKHWQDDTDLAGLRDKDAVAKLPADEREACAKLWADVAELLKMALEKSK